MGVVTGVEWEDGRKTGGGRWSGGDRTNRGLGTAAPWKGRQTETKRKRKRGRQGAVRHVPHACLICLSLSSIYHLYLISLFSPVY